MSNRLIRYVLTAAILFFVWKYVPLWLAITATVIVVANELLAESLDVDNFDGDDEA